MAAKVYVVTDSTAISYIIDDNVEGFQEYLEADEFLDFGEPELFDTEELALAFCAGLGYVANESVEPERYPLRSFEEVDRPFIEAIEGY